MNKNPSERQDKREKQCLNECLKSVCLVPIPILAPRFNRQTRQREKKCREIIFTFAHSTSRNLIFARIGHPITKGSRSSHHLRKLVYCPPDRARNRSGAIKTHQKAFGTQTNQNNCFNAPFAIGQALKRIWQ